MRYKVNYGFTKEQVVTKSNFAEHKTIPFPQPIL